MTKGTQELTRKQQAFIKERIKDKLASNSEIARRAGYSPKNVDAKASQLMHDERIQKRIQNLADVGLDALERIAKHGKNEIAVATAGKTLVETAVGKPKDNKSTTFGDITINVAKIDPTTLQAITAQQ